MAVVLFANIKGGSGKTTAALLFAGQVTAKGGKVILFEGDPNRPLARWAEARGMPVLEGDRAIDSVEAATAAIETGCGDHTTLVIHDADENRVFHWLEAATGWANFVIGDPEGSPNEWLNAVASHSDLVVIPFAPTALDSHQVSRTIQVLVRIGKMARSTVPFRLLLTKTAPGAVATRSEKDVRKTLADSGLPMIKHSLPDRQAFRAVFEHNKTLEELSEGGAALEKARDDAKAFADEVMEAVASTVSEAAA